MSLEIRKRFIFFLVDTNVTIAKSLIATGETIQDIESNLNHGRKLQGPLVALEVNAILETDRHQHKYVVLAGFIY